MATVDELRRIMSHLSLEKARQFAPVLDRVRLKYGITTDLREAAFLAQLAHESAEFRYMEEIASGQAYEGRKDLGNVHPGDGKRFKGRGPIQITGRANYEALGKALGLDLIAHPEYVAQVQTGCMAAGWFWDRHKLNDPADKGDIVRISKVINGGVNGLADRMRYYELALRVLRAG